ncbi:putative NBD/HSP70 family sugar kinase [Deinococcus metalli]|uniref:Putative NBD/HSP70 family sugar kinase n=1 Tax=Deinococcus metalli TaxID=1141878 RepID=A0A7W8NPH0_9DEIO|nr:ROK family protein [Deinococcus metalli]MBB5377974.1 putative NBD/HSP70 family sugar kinase [Deinococcus metalli]GHF53473.1 transcriptional regulator [Deinococcus metalli]
MTRSRSVRKGRSLPETRAENLSVVLEALRKLQPVSRSGLAAATDLTAATITHMVDELHASNLLIESPADTRQVGRRPTLLRLNTARGQIVGLEISRSEVRAIRTNFAGEVLSVAAQAFRPHTPVHDNLRPLIEVVRFVIDPDLPLLGIGVGVPGPVDSTRGLVLEPPNFGGWRQVPLADLLQNHFGAPCWLDDDAKAAALGERWYGAGPQVGTLLFLSLRSGVGAGLIVGDRVYRGAHELAGEIGHTTIDVNGARCECGNRGCVETLVSVPAVLADARREGLAVHDLQGVHRLAEAGDPAALRVKERVSVYLAATLVNAVNHYDPALIVLGGTLVRAWPELTEEVAHKVKGRSFGFLSKDVRIVQSLLGENATALGAAALAIGELLNGGTLRLAALSRQPARRDTAVLDTPAIT